MGIDLLRESRWQVYIETYKDYDYENWEEEPLEVLFLVTRTAKGMGCPWLDQNGKCMIYATRPDACVAFRAGIDSRCRQCKEAVIKEPL